MRKSPWSNVPAQAWIRAGRFAWLALVVVCLPAAGETFEVRVFDYFFEPFQVSIRTGDTIEWIAYGFGHTVRSDTLVFDSSEVWGSSIPALQSFRFTFHEPGLFPYYSLDYGGPDGVGMSATISVAGVVTNQIPARPTNASPAPGSLHPPTDVALRASAFVDADDGDQHLASQWLVRRVSDGTLVYDSGEVYDDGGFSSSRTNWFLPSPRLAYGSDYDWQVRYKDSYGAWSDYSATTTFSTFPPALTGTALAGAMVVAWPSNSADFMLEYSTNELLNAWFPANQKPQSLAGRLVITNSTTDLRRMYRLRKGP